MNRKNEFEALIEELNQPAPGLEATLDRAYKKKRKRTTQMIVRPLAGQLLCTGGLCLLSGSRSERIGRCGYLLQIPDRCS